MKVFIATKNQKKLGELERILKPMGFEVLSERDFPEKFDEVEETGKTFEENALIKANAGLLNTGLMSVADDSGLCVDYLDGAPGVFSARFSGFHGDDDSNNKKLLELLCGVPYEKRTAKYVAAIACVFPDGRRISAEGICGGEIIREYRGNGGFGYDPLFYVPVIGKTFAEMSAEEKNSCSHRAKAMRRFALEFSKYCN